METTPYLNLKSPFRQKKEADDKQVYEMYTRLMQEPGAMATGVETHIMEYFKLKSRSTVFKMVKRHQRRVEKAKAIKDQNHERLQSVGAV